MAMRLASHDPETHRKRAPAEPEARAAFDALEQARVEALGCVRMPGMTGNIHEMLEDRLFRANFAEVSDKGDAPLAEALGLILREKLAGVAVPPSGNAIVDLWRKEIEEKAGKSLTDAAHRASRTRTCSRAPHGSCCATSTSCPTASSTTARATTSEDGDDQEPEHGEDDDKTPEQGEGESEDAEAEEDETPGESEETGEVEGAEADMAETDEDAAAEAGEDAPNPPPPGANAERVHQPVQLQDLHPEVRRDRQGVRALPARGARPAARAARQAAREPRRRRGAARQQAAAPADGAAEPQLGVRPRGGPARHGAPHPRGHRSAAGAELQGRAATPISATPW